jgi:flavin reductase (DIM6/NTAB) family NADH-FMN oxidoreductase RutF
VIAIDPATVENLIAYKLMTGIMVPRPIAFVSTVGTDGVFNVAPFSHSTVVSLKPPIVAFTAGRTPLRESFKLDTLRNVEETGAFVTNIVTYEIERPMVEASAEVPADVDEFALAGLTPVPSDLVAAPRVGEAVVSFECRLENVLEMGGGDCWLVLGRVVRIHVDPSAWVDGRLDLSAFHHTGRMGGTEYVRTDDQIRLSDLGEALDAPAQTDYRYQ